MSCLIKSRGCFCARAAKEARSAIVKSIMEIPSGCGFSAQPNISCRSQPNTRLRGEFAEKFARKIHGAQYCGTQGEVKRLRHYSTIQPTIHPSIRPRNFLASCPFTPVSTGGWTETEEKGQFVTRIHFGEEKSWEKFYFLISLHFRTTTMATNSFPNQGSST